jgi:hypothetical protein
MLRENPNCRLATFPGIGYVIGGVKRSVREVLLEEIKDNPRWVEAKPSGEAYEILGAVALGKSDADKRRDGPKKA